MALEVGVTAQELSLEEVVPTTSSSGMLDDGKLDLVMVTVPETATVEVRNLRYRITERSITAIAVLKTAGGVFPKSSLLVAHPERDLACFT